MQAIRRMQYQPNLVAPHPGLREAVGVFDSAGDLEAAVGALASAGWDHADFSLLANDTTLQPHIPARAITGVADDRRTPRDAITTDDDMRQGRVLTAGMAGVIAAFIAAGATIASGGTALIAVIGGAAAGGTAVGGISAIGHWIEGKRDKFLGEQLAQGGILLWVRLRAPDEDDRAEAILRAHGARHVHVHEVAAP